MSMVADSSLVSIIIPTHNDRQWVSGAIDSALAQSYPHCEVIVVDDGSTDGTQDYLSDRYGDRIKFIYKSNSGPASARNIGVAAASGSFIQFLDSDDFIPPNKIARQMEVFSENPKCDVVYCDFAYTTEGPEGIVEESPAAHKKNHGAENVFEALLDGNFIVIHSPLTRASVIRDCGGFDEGLPSDEDYDLWLRIAANGYRFCFIPEVLALYRKRNNSVSRNYLRQSKGTISALNKAPSYRTTLTDSEMRNLKRTLSREYGWIAHTYIGQLDYGQGLKAVWSSLLNNPGHGLSVATKATKQIVRQILNRHLFWRIGRK
jgi:glycosyltransferase involved in cell wall biosynthesis